MSTVLRHLFTFAFCVLLAFGVAANNSTANATQGAQSGYNAVNFNYLNAEDKVRKDVLDAKQQAGLLTPKEAQEQAELNSKNLQSDAALNGACANGASAACTEQKKLAMNAQESYQGYAEYQTFYDVGGKYPEEMAKYKTLIGDYSRELTNLVDQGYSVTEAQQRMATDSATAAKYQKAMDEVPNWAKIAMTVQDTVGMVYGAKLAGNSVQNLAQNQQLIKNAETISTAKAGSQFTVPRDLNEQILWKQVTQSPSKGFPLKGMNTDPRFPLSAGFQKMSANHQLPDGSNVEIHYQYNATTGKAYDMKIVTPQRSAIQLKPSIKDKP